MRQHKNYYNFSFGNYCGVIVDEKVMKEIGKLQYETYNKLRSILDNAENVHAAHWTISKGPEGLDQNERTCHYCDDADYRLRLDLAKELFRIDKVDDLYFVDGSDIMSHEAAQAEHEEHLRKLHGIEVDDE